MLPRLLWIVANPGPVSCSHPVKDASPERDLQGANRGAASASGSLSRQIRVHPRPSVVHNNRSPQVVTDSSPHRNPVSTVPVQASKVIGNKGLTVTLTPLESTLIGYVHLIQNTQVQLLQNQHLRIFSPQVLWIQHLHENVGGGPGNFFEKNSPGIAVTTSPHQSQGVQPPGSA
jgi:hypothetical protein